GCKVVFVGPCTAKKVERQQEHVKDLVDNVITFEELRALIDSQEIDLEEMPLEQLNDASYYGRIFARSGGLADAVKQALKELKITDEQFKLNAISCSGINECKAALLKAKVGRLQENFIEGMACVDGCIGGPCALTHGPKDRAAVDKFGKESRYETIGDAIGKMDI
ncbi:MAG: ferredoxin, partial [Christensenellaceae bacterium]|nr:ferredoxin [Christensenellaceae bacterium]